MTIPVDDEVIRSTKNSRAPDRVVPDRPSRISPPKFEPCPYVPIREILEAADLCTALEPREKPETKIDLKKLRSTKKKKPNGLAVRSGVFPTTRGAPFLCAKSRLLSEPKAVVGYQPRNQGVTFRVT